MTQAIIIGAGIAGPVTAMALQRAGIESTVYEAYDRTADGVGAFLTMAVNGLEALRTIDIDPYSLGGFDTPAMALHSATGRELAVFGTGRPGTDLVSQTVKRADLYLAMRDEAVRRGIRIEYGKRLADAVTGLDGTVTAEFTDGTRAAADVLIGADGLHSRTRTLIDPNAAVPRYTGLLNTGGIARGITVDDPVGRFNMMFGRRGFFGYISRSPGEVWWFANVPQAEELSAEQLAKYTPEGWRAELNRMVADDRGPALDIIAATEQIVLPWNTTDLPNVQRWQAGAMVLIGDAAHAISPTSGQGAALAAEDAVVLAKLLRDHDVPTALAAYETARRERVEKLIEQAKRTSDSKIPSLFNRVVRDHLVLPLVARHARRAATKPDWVLDYRIDWDAPVAR